MSYTDISDRIMTKLRAVVKDQEELEMIVDLLRNEKRNITKDEYTNFKQEFKTSISEHFPLKDSKNE